MNTRTPAALLSFLPAVALVAAAAEPAADATDSCVQPGENFCSPGLPGPSHTPEQDLDHAVVELAKAEQAPPPPPMPPGRGMTYTMEDPSAAWWDSWPAVRITLPQFRNAAVLASLSASPWTLNLSIPRC